MTQAEITALLNTLPDEWIESAAAPRKRNRISLLRTVPAVAACMIVLIAAAVYPRLKGHTPPRVPETDAVTAETGTTAQTETEKISGTAVSSGTASAAESGETAVPQTGLTGASEDSAASSATAVSRSTSRQQSTVTTAKTESVSGSRTTENSAESTAKSVTTMVYETLSDPDKTEEGTAPWSCSTALIRLYRQGGDIEESAAEMNTVYARFEMYTAETPDPVLTAAGLSDFDFSQYDCLLLHIQTNCTDAAVTACRLEQNGLVLTVSCLDAPSYQDKDGILFLLQLPKSLHIRVTDCRAEYQHLTDRAAYLSRLTDTLVLNLPK